MNISKYLAEIQYRMNLLGKARVPFFVMVDFEMKRPLLIPLSEINKKDILFEMDGSTNAERGSNAFSKINLTPHPHSFSEYQPIFGEAIKELKFGNSYLLNLTQETLIDIDADLDEVFYASNAKFKLRYKDEFVVFSPERFVKIENNTIKTFPMKGTIDASIPNAKSIILNDAKEKAEHNTIVDFLRNDLNMVAKKVKVNRFRYIEHIKTKTGGLLQVSSEIEGELAEDWRDNIGDVLIPLLPAGSISGAPKQKTVEIIQRIEGYNRGYYTGVFGIFDGDQFDSSVMIRFIEKKGKEFYYKSGGGVTAMSDAKEEYKELINKIYVPVIGNHTDSRRRSDATSMASTANGE